MDICVNCKHHRKEGQQGIRCWSGVIERIERDPVTGARRTRLNKQPVACSEKRLPFPDTCAEYAPSTDLVVKVGE